MAVNVPSFIPEPFANEGQRATIPGTPSSEQGRASYQQGFPQVCAQPLASGGIPPNYLDFQGILYDLSNSICYMQTGALWPWSADLTYPLGAHVLGSDNNEYVAVQESTGRDPTQDTTGTYWRNRDAFRLSLIGMIATFASTNLPEGWMICDGSSVLFADWPEFQQVFNEGRFTGMTLSASDPAQVGKFVLNGSTGVYLPDLEGLYEQASSAANAGGYLAAGLPNIKGSFNGAQLIDDAGTPTATGAFSVGGAQPNDTPASPADNKQNGFSFSAAQYNAIYSDSVDTVQPPSVQYVRAMYLGKPKLRKTA